MKRRSFIHLLSAGIFLGDMNKLLAWTLKRRGGIMIHHPAETRGHADHGWLKANHSFSFANYYNPERMGFGALRVINDDFIAAGMGFGTHPHRDMEIITIPLEGALAHKDSTGGDGQIRLGEVQVMSAGTGIAHSEFNASTTEPVKLLQIWVLPKSVGVKPRYDQKKFGESKNKLTLLVSPDAREGSLAIHQDAFFSRGEFAHGSSFTYTLKDKRHGVYAFVIKGSVSVNGVNLKARDGLGLSELEAFEVKASSDMEILLMEVPL